MLHDDEVRLPGGPRLAMRRADGAGRPFLLVHGLASNTRLWDGVGRRLAEAGHEVVAVDLRGHGRSEQTAAGYDTSTAAADLARLCGLLGLTAERAPVAAGQSWGGNVVLTLAARHGGVAALGLVDGGWLRLRDRFTDFAECWDLLAPPRFDGTSMADLRARAVQWHADWPDEARAGALASFEELPDGTARARLTREHHRDILAAMWDEDPRELYPLVEVPVLLAAAVAAEGEPAAARPEVLEAHAALVRSQVRWYAGADHDLHAQQPQRLAGDLLALAAAVDGSSP